MIRAERIQAAQERAHGHLGTALFSSPRERAVLVGALPPEKASIELRPERGSAPAAHPDFKRREGREESANPRRIGAVVGDEEEICGTGELTTLEHEVEPVLFRVSGEDDPLGLVMDDERARPFVTCMVDPAMELEMERAVAQM